MNKLEILKQWENDYKLLSESWDHLEKSIGAEHDSPLGRATWGLFDNYTDSIAKLVGDKSDWLVWYCWCNAMGKNHGGVKLSANDFPMLVGSLEDLLEVIDYESKV